MVDLPSATFRATVEMVPSDGSFVSSWSVPRTAFATVEEVIRSAPFGFLPYPGDVSWLPDMGLFYQVAQGEVRAHRASGFSEPSRTINHRHAHRRCSECRPHRRKRPVGSTRKVSRMCPVIAAVASRLGVAT